MESKKVKHNSNYYELRQFLSQEMNVKILSNIDYREDRSTDLGESRRKGHNSNRTGVISIINRLVLRNFQFNLHQTY